MSNQNQSDTVPVLTNLFINLCAINAIKMHLINIPENQREEFKNTLVSQWELECRKLFDNQALGFQEHIKGLKPSDRLKAAIEIDKLKDQFELDFQSSKQIVSNLF